MITGPRSTLKLARKLRREMTLPEGLLWRELRARPGGFKFRRQHPPGAYVLDFYCAAARFAIEVDGFAHDTGTVVKRDETRAHFLRSQGVATLRIPANVILQNVDRAVARIVEVCEARLARGGLTPPVPLHQPAAGPPPRAGEE